MFKLVICLSFGAMLIAIGVDPSLEAQESESRLAALGQSVQIGRLEGSEDEIFGLIEDGVVWSSHFFIADSRLQQVRKYSPSGELVARTGRGGRGPGEFYVLTSLATLSGQRLAVFDKGNRRITVYSSDLLIVDEVPLRNLFSDICGLGDRLFVQGLHDEGTIHEISLKEKRIIHSFGTLPEAMDASPNLARMALRNRTQAALICDDRRDQLIEVHRSTRHVRAFSSDGEMLWEVALPGYREVSLQLTRRGTVAMVPDPETDTEHYLAASTLIDDDHLLVQHAVISRATPEVDSGRLDAWLINLADGTVQSTESGLPRLLDRAHGRSLYASNLPFPQVRLVTSETVERAR